MKGLILVITTIGLFTLINPAKAQIPTPTPTPSTTSTCVVYICNPGPPPTLTTKTVSCSLEAQAYINASNLEIIERCRELIRNYNQLMKDLTDLGKTLY